MITAGLGGGRDHLRMITAGLGPARPLAHDHRGSGGRHRRRATIGSVLDLDRPVSDLLLLRTVPGAVDYLAEDLRSLGPATARVERRWRDALLVEYAGPLAPLAAVRYFSSCSVWLGAGAAAPPGDGLDRPALAASRGHGVLRALGPGPLTFRVADIGAERWPVRDELTGLGWHNRPTAWEVNVDTYRDHPVLDVGALFFTARFGALARLPASTTPVVAAVLARLVEAGPDDVVLDPFCGAGTILVQVAQMSGPARLLGSDLDRGALDRARANLAARGIAAQLAQADAARLPGAPDSVDRIVANLPFGKRAGSHAANVDLYPAFLRRVRAVLRPTGRAVLLTEEKRLLRDAVRRTADLGVVKEVGLESGGLHPSAYVVLNRPRGRRRSG
jgi:tRNA (guanine6-N2)-methyltransferase